MTKIFYLDPGHGGDDSGATANGLKEKDLVLDLSKRIKAYIESRYDVDCRLSRSTDRFVTLSGRTNEANKLNSDCLVSVHINAASAAGANGFESFVYLTDGANSKSVALQKKLHAKISPLWVNRGRKDRGKKKENFHIVREFKGAAVLLEFGFLTNDTDASHLKDESFLQINAEATAQAVAEYLELEPKDKAKLDSIYRVSVDGKQVGAYADTDNVVNQVEKALNKGADNLVISKK